LLSGSVCFYIHCILYVCVYEQLNDDDDDDDDQPQLGQSLSHFNNFSRNIPEKIWLEVVTLFPTSPNCTTWGNKECKFNPFSGFILLFWFSIKMDERFGLATKGF